MTDPTSHPAGVTPERLAALLDGRLDERERAQVLRAIDEDPELRAAYADAVAVESELAGAATAGGGDVRPFRREVARQQWRSGRALLMAAGLAGILFVPWVMTWSREAVIEPSRLVAQLDVESPVAMPAEPWAVTRGAGAVMSERGRAARLGARLVDLEVAIAARDSGMRVAAAASVVSLATADAPLTGAPVDLYRRIAAGDVAATEDRGARREGWEAMSELAGEEAMRLGAWLEAARVAAVRRDAEFFRSRATGRVLDAAVAATDADERAAMARVRGAVASGIPEWAMLATALEEALRVAGR